MDTRSDLPILLLRTQADWQMWLGESYAQTAGVWLKIAKKASGLQSVSYSEALDVALCYGWIDGQKQAYDEHYFLQKFTPRRAKSLWSKVNVGKVAILTAAGKMQPSGLAAVAAAQADGRWDQAYDSPSKSTVPSDFQAQLDQHPRAKEFFATLNKTNTYAFLWRIETAKTPQTRSSRIEKFIAMLEAGQKLY